MRSRGTGEESLKADLWGAFDAHAILLEAAMNASRKATGNRVKNNS
jgi:hypothetical protein